MIAGRVSRERLIQQGSVDACMPARCGTAPRHELRCQIKWATMKTRTAEARRRRAEKERHRYTAERLASLRKRFPELPHDVLDRAALRQISVAVRKVGVGQRTLGAFSDEEGSSDPLSKSYFATNDEEPSVGG